MKVDLHIHSAASDGSDTPRILLDKLIAAGIRVFAVTDHDTVSGMLEMEPLLPDGVKMLRGIEFSCKTTLGKCHILGYGFDPAAPSFQNALQEGIKLRKRKLQLRLEFLRNEFGVVLTEEEKTALASTESPGKPHLGKILVDRGLAADLSDAIHRCIDRCKTGSDRINASLAIDGILQAGGIPVWAHPLGGEGEARIGTDAFFAELEMLKQYGIRGLECFYSRYGPAEIEFLLQMAKEHGLLISGGSDYHGDNKPDLRLGMLGADQIRVRPDMLSVL